MIEPTILLVEDDEPLRYSLARELVSSGFRVADCEDAFDAIDIIGRSPIDQIVTDIAPGYGRPHGIAIAQMARLKRGASLPVIFLTGFDEYRHLASPLGPVFIKPVDVRQISRSAANLLSITNRAGAAP